MNDIFFLKFKVASSMQSQLPHATNVERSGKIFKSASHKVYQTFPVGHSYLSSICQQKKVHMHRKQILTSSSVSCDQLSPTAGALLRENIWSFEKLVEDFSLLIKMSYINLAQLAVEAHCKLSKSYTVLQACLISLAWLSWRSMWQLC